MNHSSTGFRLISTTTASLFPSSVFGNSNDMSQDIVMVDDPPSSSIILLLLRLADEHFLYKCWQALILSLSYPTSVGASWLLLPRIPWSVVGSLLPCLSPCWAEYLFLVDIHELLFRRCSFTNTNPTSNYHKKCHQYSLNENEHHLESIQPPDNPRPGPGL